MVYLMPKCDWFVNIWFIFLTFHFFKNCSVFVYCNHLFTHGSKYSTPIQIICRVICFKYFYPIQIICRVIWFNYSYPIQIICRVICFKYFYPIQIICRVIWFNYSYPIQIICRVICFKYSTSILIILGPHFFWGGGGLPFYRSCILSPDNRFGLVWFGLAWLYGISTIVGYLIPNLFLYIQSVLFQTIQLSKR